MNHLENILDDIEGVRRSVCLAVCRTIWHYYRLTKGRNSVHSIKLPQPDDNIKYPASAPQVLQIIQSLLRSPLDLLSMKLDLSGELRKFPGYRTCRWQTDKFTRIGIMHWSIYLGLTEVVDLILDIDPGQASIRFPKQNNDLFDGGTPLHALMGKVTEDSLPLLRRLCDLNPDSLSTPDARGDLPLHKAAEYNKCSEIIRFLLDRYNDAAGVCNLDGRYPLHVAFYNHEDLEDWEMEIHRMLIEANPIPLKNVLPTLDCWMYHGMSELEEEGLKMVFELGKIHNVFHPSTCHGLFTKVSPKMEKLVSESQWLDWEDRWDEYFKADRFIEGSSAKRTLLEIFLFMYSDIDDSHFVHGWDEASHVFEAVMDTPLLQPAIGKVQDDLLPLMIEKFGLSLLQTDDYGNTPLIVSLYNTVFVEVENNEGYRQWTRRYRLRIKRGSTALSTNTNSINDADIIEEEEDRNINVGSNIFEPERNEKGVSCQELSDASMVLSYGASTYKRRKQQVLKCDVISMMVANEDRESSMSRCRDKKAISNAAMMRDVNGRYPLHIGSSIGLKWHAGLKTVLEAHQAAVKVADPMTGLYSFMLAAIGEHSDLSTVYRLMVEYPSAVYE